MASRLLVGCLLFGSRGRTLKKRRRKRPKQPLCTLDRKPKRRALGSSQGGMLARPRVARPRQRETEPRCNILALVCCAVCIALLSAEDFVRLHTTPPSSVTPRTQIRPIEAREDSPLSPSPPPPSPSPSPQSSPPPPPPPPPPSTHSAKNEAFLTEPVACSSSRLSTVLAPSCGSEADAEAQADAHDSARLQVCVPKGVHGGTGAANVCRVPVLVAGDVASSAAPRDVLPL